MNTTKNDVFFVSTLIEKIARLTKNTRRKIAEVLGIQGIEEQLRLADVNHCLPMIQVGTVRLSLSFYSTARQLEQAADKVCRLVKKL